jgi:hypothetical protein
MKVVRLGMTESGLLLLNYVLTHLNPNDAIKQNIAKYMMSLVNWLYKTSGYYDKTVHTIDFTAINSNFLNFIKHLEISVGNCEKTQFFFHEGFVMSLFNKCKEQFVKHYKINNLVILNGTVFSDRIQHDFFDYMREKKVLVISSFDGLIKQQFDSGNVYKIFPNFPIVKSLNVLKFPYCFFNNGPHDNYFETLDVIFHQLKSIDFDIALLACGSYGHMLCHKIHDELNKEAIYVGGSITNLFGILTTRERESNKIVTNEFWITEIPDEYKPPNYKMVENGCYW